MPAYLKIEESKSNAMHANNIIDSVMDLSLLAVLIAPFAALALILHTLDIAMLSQNTFIASASALFIALPQLVRWLITDKTQTLTNAG